MELSHQDIELIERYLQHQLEDEELVAFEARLEADPVFKEEVVQWAVVNAQLGHHKQEEKTLQDSYKDKMSSWLVEVENSANQEPYSTGIKKWWWILPLLLAIALGAYLLSGNKENVEEEPIIEIEEPSRIIADHIDFLPRQQSTLSAESNLDSISTLAFAAYDEERFEEAYPLLVEVVNSGGDSLNLLYAGIAALQIGESEKAKALLAEGLSYPPNAILKTDFQYYLFLAEVDLGNLEEAREISNSCDDTLNAGYCDDMDDILITKNNNKNEN